jgi:hypothetical protein
MSHSHRPSLAATTSMRAPFGAQPDAQDAPASRPRTSEGPVPEWAPEAQPSDSSPTAHISQELQGFPPSRCSVRPLRWADPADVRAWLDQGLASVADLAAVAREGSRRLKRRVLSRAELRRQARAAERSLRVLFAAAAAGLPAVKGDTVE